eukprot:scaffold91079_cov59-Phaeocystis_antarctica.AAC.1
MPTLTLILTPTLTPTRERASDVRLGTRLGVRRRFRLKWARCAACRRRRCVVGRERERDVLTESQERLRTRRVLKYRITGTSQPSVRGSLEFTPLCPVERDVAESRSVDNFKLACQASLQSNVS